ncbi:uncharacterized protein LOC110771064 [Prunus avium]|uniref:Uncharacterized protein LOC110771064 n=1 Tax=Prunus avium TaxID=42229 RepID=A0A6P5TW30_PRUAV|nr:uncharacterized protein LOC110771064 [Prunus avium]
MAGIEGQNENDVSDSMRIMLAIQDMASTIRETNNHEPHQETQDDQIMRIQGEFRKTRPPVFKGDPNPMVAEEWLRQMRRKMNEQRVPGNLKVTIASTYLEGQAYHWWESVLAIPDVEIATWVAFETIFLEKYFPETMKTMKVREFTNLYQGDMTVGQYQAKFEELMRFAPYMIPNESAKAKKFEEGLRLEVKEKVELFKLKKYVEVVDRALMAEQRILSSKRIFEPKNPNRGQSSKRQRFFPSRSRHNVQEDNLHNKGLRHQEQQGDHNNLLKDEYMLVVEQNEPTMVEEYEFMKSSLMIGSPLGKCAEVNKLCRSCIIEISDHKLVVDLMILEFMGYDVILGMDLLTQFKAILDCDRKMVNMTLSDGS